MATRSYRFSIKDWSIKYKVMTVAAIGVVAFVFYLLLNFYANIQNERRLSEIRDVDFPVLEIINNSSIALTDIKQSLTDAVSASEEDSLTAAKEVAAKILQDIRSIAKFSPELSEESGQLESSFSLYFDTSMTVARGLMEGTLSQEEMITLVPRINTSFIDFETKISSFRENQTVTFAEKLTATQKMGEQSWQIGAAAGTGLIVVLAMFSYWLTTLITRGLNHAVDVADRISEGEWDTQISIDTTDETGHLLQAIKKMRNRLKSRTEEDHRKERMQTQFAELNERLRGDVGTDVLCRNVLDFLTPALDCQLGALYQYDENTEELKLISSYAYSKRKGNNNVYKLGESIVGQAALERKQICISHLPSDYIEVSSALGGSIPKNILVSPVVHEENLMAVIELGSIYEISKENMEFLEKCIDSIAVALNSAQSRVQLAGMLQHSQEQAEALSASESNLQAQQDELKSANEGLESQTSALMDSEKQLQTQQEELRATNEELEEQAQALRASEENLQAQQEELRVTNEELAEQAKLLEKQKSEMEDKNTALEKAQHVLEEKSDALEVSSKYKSEFLSTMSHELRTPLNSILILSNNLAENRADNLSEKQVEHAEVINSAGSDLLSLINDILDLSKVEEGKLQLVLEDLDTKIIQRNIQLNFEHVAKERSLDFGVVIEEGLPSSIRTDRQRLEQVLKNLLSNAFKFTSSGGVYLHVGRPRKEFNLDGLSFNHENGIALSVRDTGVGIPDEKQQIIFEAFQQADGTTSRKYGGTGLGLTISRELSKMLHGDLRLTKAVEDEGSEFTLFIPEFLVDDKAEMIESEGRAEFDAPVMRTTKEETAVAESARESRDHSVLIIEDDEDFAHLLKQMAEEHGLDACVALDGESGLAYAQKNHPGAIILDVGLPGMDGWSVMEKLQENELTKDIPVHFLSGKDEKSKAMKMGALDHLTKPVNKDQVVTVFDKIEDAIAGDVRRLLVVEDNKVAHEAIACLFEEHGIEVTSAVTGEEALEFLKTRPFDCMILDLNLPDTTGFQLLETLNQKDDIPKVPVVIYTAKDLMREEETKLRKYADRIILKTDQSSERLLNEVSLFLHWLGNKLPDGQAKTQDKIDRREDVFEGKKLLLVDDDMRNIYSLTAILEDKGFDISVASNGRESLDVLKENPDKDLILMDIMMPEMDGYEAMTEIRKQECFSELPIIALTAKAMKGDKKKCIDAGANDYISKPLDTDKLLSLMRVWLQQ